jgi:hypothetical protein
LSASFIVVALGTSATIVRHSGLSDQGRQIPRPVRRAADQLPVLLFVGAPEDFESLAGRRVNAKSTDRSVERMLGKVTTLAGSHQYRKLRIVIAAYMTCSGYGLTSLLGGPAADG